MTRDELATRLRAARERTGLSLRDASACSGVLPETIRSWEHAYDSENLVRFLIYAESIGLELRDQEAIRLRVERAYKRGSRDTIQALSR